MDPSVSHSRRRRCRDDGRIGRRRPNQPLLMVRVGIGDRVRMRGLRVWRQLDALGRTPLIQRISHLCESSQALRRSE